MTTTDHEIAFVGPSGSGKTTLIERVLGRLAGQGLAVGVVKHTHHHIDMDQPGKDSWRFREAGASRVVLATPERLTLQLNRPADDAGDLLRGVDLIIHEGNRKSLTPKILVGESIQQAMEKGTAGRIVAVVEGPRVEGLPWFQRDDIEGVAGLVRGFAREPVLANSFEALLERSVAAHGHLCPGQVLGVRMTMRGLRELGLAIPPPAKRLIAVVETDRCAADAVASVSGCSLGRRTLKHFDFGKMAATFLDMDTEAAVRVAARDDSRERVACYAPGIPLPHDAQTAAYRVMSDDDLMTVQRVRLTLADADMPGRPRFRVPCSSCGEHVSDEREVLRDGRTLCKACAGARYYVPL